MNYILDTEGKVPFDLVFGKYSQLRARGIGNLPKSDLVEQSGRAEETRKEMAKKMTRIYLDRELQHQVPESAQVSYKPGDRVLVW